MFNRKQLLRAANEFGTPLYVYNEETITTKYNTLKDAFKHIPVKIKYACKALSNVHILKHIKSLGAGIDAVSIEEVHIAMIAGFEPAEILFTPNGVAISEIHEAVQLGVVINIDNISILEQFGHTYRDTVPCCIRFNPHIEAGGHHHIQTGHIDSKFGISVYQMRHVLRLIQAHQVQVIGLHMHTGSDILDASAFLQGADILFDCAKHFNALQFLDFGSGFKVAYKENDIVTDVVDLGAQLTEKYNEFTLAFGKQVEIWFEPGKYLVSEAGVLLVQVNVVKPTMATVFAGVNSGQNHLIRPMFYDAYHQIENITNPSGIPRIYTVVGYICETDTFGRDRKIAEVREGDILVIKNAGAYGFSMSNNYNSRCRPAEVLMSKTGMRLIRKRETIDDLLRNQLLTAETAIAL
jgi:diaminopimelate decarboxylase